MKRRTCLLRVCPLGPVAWFAMARAMHDATGRSVLIPGLGSVSLDGETVLDGQAFLFFCFCHDRNYRKNC